MSYFYRKTFVGAWLPVGHIAEYSDGLGVTRDYKEALKWFRKSALHGNASGQLNLGLMYRDGHGVEKDHDEAAKWFFRAAEQGSEEAERELARLRSESSGLFKEE